MQKSPYLRTKCEIQFLMVGYFNGFFVVMCFSLFFDLLLSFSFIGCVFLMVVSATRLINTWRIYTMQWIISGKLLCGQLLRYEEA